MKRGNGERPGAPLDPLRKEKPSREAELFGVEHAEDTDDVDLHGMDAWDAQQECERAIDAAFYAGDLGITITHGIGGGVLRRLVREQILPRHPLVEAWRSASHPFGSSRVVVLVKRRG
ncbi:MAG: Smr/MutS family protein [Patescibacteria group bacterium]